MFFFFFSLSMSVSTWTPSISLSHLVMHKQVSPHRVFLQRSRATPSMDVAVWTLCTKARAGFVVIFNAQHSRAAFSGAMERNIELGPQETQLRQIYHNLLHGYSSGFWHSLPDSGTKTSTSIQRPEQTIPALILAHWLGTIPWAYPAFPHPPRPCSNQLLKARNIRWHHPPCSSPIPAPTTAGTSTQSKIHIFLPSALPGASRLA